MHVQGEPENEVRYNSMVMVGGVQCFKFCNRMPKTVEHRFFQ